MTIRQSICGLALALGVTSVGGCVVCPTPTPQQIHKLVEDSLRPGIGTEQDAILKYGAPSGVFEKEKVLTWRLTYYPGKGLCPTARAVALVLNDDDDADWQGTLIDLVVTFDDQRRVRSFREIPILAGMNGFTLQDEGHP